jgi:hypothetical protein
VEIVLMFFPAALGAAILATPGAAAALTE